jgi:hypothetical protein
MISMRGLLKITMAALLLAGCATHWERLPDAGVQQASFSEDKARCYLFARGMPKQGYMYAGGGTGRAGAYAAAGAGIAAGLTALGQVIQEVQDRNACMAMAGWVEKQGSLP